jgi:hypothetical protein
MVVVVVDSIKTKKKQKQKRTLTEKGQGGVGGHLHARLHYDLPTFASIVDIDRFHVVGCGGMGCGACQTVMGGKDQNQGTVT